MKNKKIYLILFAVALFAIMLFANTTDVHATVYGAEDFYIRTKIERWSDNNDLVFTKNDDWNGTWYTKTVYLTTNETGDPTDTTNGGTYVQITEERLDNENKYYLNINNFQNGSDVYLVEKYHITSTSSMNAVLGGTGSSNTLPSNDSLDFSFDTSTGTIGETIKNNSMQNYYPDGSYSIKAVLLYDSSDPSSEYRSTDIYLSMSDFSGDTSVKTDSESKGTINLPIYGLKAGLRASGNLVSAGYFGVEVDTGSNNDEYPNAGSGIGSTSGYVEKNDNYSLRSYESITNYYSTPWYYWNSNAATSSGRENVQNIEISELTQDTDLTNTYYRTIYGTYEDSQSISNGIFYNILPFAIAGLVAIAGIVILKKNSIK